MKVAKIRGFSLLTAPFPPSHHSPTVSTSLFLLPPSLPLSFSSSFSTLRFLLLFFYRLSYLALKSLLSLSHITFPLSYFYFFAYFLESSYYFSHRSFSSLSCYVFPHLVLSVYIVFLIINLSFFFFFYPFNLVIISFIDTFLISIFSFTSSFTLNAL